MKVSTSITLLALSFSSAGAFAPPTFAVRRDTSLSMTTESSRANFLKQLATSAAVVAVSLPSPANAAKYGGIGKGSPEVLDPKSAIIDDEVLKSDAVQNALAGVRQYLKSAKEISASLGQDSQLDVSPRIRKELEISTVRNDLNALNAAFDEDTQRGTDRLIRAILQDINELEIANKQKPGVTRSNIRLDNLKGKVNKLAKAFEDYLAFV